VKLFLEINRGFIKKTGGDGPRNANGIPQNVINYINTLVTAANVIFESEIDTRLVVHTIKVSTIHWPTNHDSSDKNSFEALKIMWKTYGAKAWHTKGVDLHHAMLGNIDFGGRADFGGLCNPEKGYGVTSNYQGDFKSLDQMVVWDLVHFMHELGHNFGAKHTHEYVVSEFVHSICWPISCQLAHILV
jgi:hypothetical protein